MATTMSADDYPPWVVLHLPHDSTDVPAGVRSQFLLNDKELEQELLRMTDHYTARLFVPPTSSCVTVRAPVSRLVVDVERFPDDAQEPMAARGMGAVYTVTSDLRPLRRPLSDAERVALMDEYYQPHHARLEAAVRDCLLRYGQCLVVDCHSFPDQALPYEFAAPGLHRPQICIGADAFHTSDALSGAFVASLSSAGFDVRVNDPFAGALVPAFAYRTDPRVSAVMVEVNRRLYMTEADGAPRADFDRCALQIRQCCSSAIDIINAGHRRRS
jgi:N-formylglutamate amidohydrolase